MPNGASEDNPQRVKETKDTMKKIVGEVNDSFFVASIYDAFVSEDFSKIYSYYFKVYDVTAKDDDDADGVLIEFYLPISPTNISINTPSASSLAVTMKGIVEDHNGAPLRPISVRGTSGILPREHAPAPTSAGPNNVLEAIFKNTFQQAVRVANQFEKLSTAVSSLTGGSSVKAIINFKNSEITGKTGYDFIHELMLFFDGYLAAKKSKVNAGLRLAFVMVKDRAEYDVKLEGYRVRKNPGTLEYEYDIDMTAWRKRKLGSDHKAITGITTKAQDLNKIAQFTKAVREYRTLIAASLGVLSGIRSDIEESFLTPLREVILFGSDVVSIPVTLYDFPSTVVESAKASVIQTLKEAKGTLSPTIAKFQQSLVDNGIYGSGSSSVNGGGPVDDLIQYNDAKSKAAQTAASDAAADMAMANIIFKKPELFPDIFDQLRLDMLQLSAETQRLIDEQLERVRHLTANDLRQKRDTIKSFNQSISEALGGGSTTYNRVNGSPPPKKAFKELTVDDIVLLSQLNDIVQTIDSTIASFENGTPDATNDYYKFYADYARSNSITFADSKSKFYVPFPYGASLESLAVQYLGNSNRWLEIAALNGLKAPYIDEEGFEVKMADSGSGNLITIANSDGLYVGQTIQVMSDIVAPSVRKISSIDVVSSIQTILTVDGASDLAIYLVSQNARIKIFKPNTVNSLQMIAIPSGADVTVPSILKIVPTSKDLDAITLVALTDLQLQSNGDLVITSSGEVGLASGVSNIVQAARIKLLTKAGSIVSDPTFGNPLSAGMSVADVRANQVLAMLSSIFKDDKRFGNILAGSVAIKGPGAEVQMLVHVQGTDVNLPLVTELPL